MNTKILLSLLLSLGLTFSLASGQNCSSVSNSINQDFTGMAHGSRPACWVTHFPGWTGTFSGVYNGDYRYHLLYNSSGYPTNHAQVKPFYLVMQRCSMHGLLTFSLSQYLNAYPAVRYFDVGTMSDPNNPATFTFFQRIDHQSATPTNFSVDLSSYMGSDQYIAFRTHLSNGNAFSIDNIVWSDPSPFPIVLPPKGPL